MTGICIGLDIGTSNMTAYVEGKGIVFSRPSAIACDTHTGRILAVGEDAFAMTGRTPGSVTVIRPFSEGVVSDMKITVAMLSQFIDEVCRLTVLKPNIIAGVPGEITGVERNAILDVLKSAGASRVCIMEHPYAAAVGADVAFTKPYGTMLIDIGGGTVDISVVSMNSVAAVRTLRFGSEALTQDIIKYLRRERDIEVGYLTAEDIKKTIGGAVVRNEEIALVAKGRNAVTGSPINFEVTSTEVYWAIKEHIDMILTGVKEILSSISPELSADIFESGIVLTGKGSLLYGIDSFLESSTGVQVRIAKEPWLCVAKGLGKSMHNIRKLKKSGYGFEYFNEL
ncbi:MAG: rod shape-determining protein [Clostridia bacterium]|nr:rod shape-determining protein [Clostridia bacterium]